MILLDSPILHNIHITNNPIRIKLPNDHLIVSTHTANLALPELPHQATVAHLFPDMGSSALLSIGLLCDAGCIATFTDDTATITLHGHTILTGTRNIHTDKLWQMNVPSPPTPQDSAMAATTTASAAPADLVAFAHAAMFSPVLSTLRQALTKKFIMNLPGLTLATLKKHPPHSTATAKGHLNQTRQGIKSTKSMDEPLPLLDTSDTDMYPTSEDDNARTHY